MQTTDWYSRTLLAAIAGLLLFISIKLNQLNQNSILSTRQTGLVESQHTSFSDATTVAFRQSKPNIKEKVQDVIDVRLVGVGGAFDGTSRLGVPVYILNSYADSQLPVPVYNVPPPR